ncbi:MAG: hypothetical protein ACK55E_12815 [Cyanobacteriota bacterium]|jgi:hypothetical protein
MDLFWRQLASLLGPPGPSSPLVSTIASPQVGDRRILLRAPQSLTIARLDAVLSGGSNPSLSLQLRHGPDVSAAGTALLSSPLVISSSTGGTSTGTVLTSFLTPAVPADHWLWLEVTAVSGSPIALTVAVRFS